MKKFTNHIIHNFDSDLSEEIISGILNKSFIKLICKQSIVIISLVSLILISCETQINWYLQTEEIPVIIVDGIITNKIKAHEIKITKPTITINTSSEAVSNAVVAISDQENIFILNESSENPGIYLTDTTFVALYGKKYTLYIKYEGKEYFATSSMVQVLLFDPLVYSLRDDTAMYKIDYVAEQYTSDTAMYHIEIDWTHVPGYDSVDIKKKTAKIFYYSLPSIDVSELFAADKEQIFFPEGTIITQTKYSLSDEHAEFIRTLLSETEWRGGFFDVAPGNVATNLSEGALGFFGACTVTSITIRVE